MAPVSRAVDVVLPDSFDASELGRALAAHFEVFATSPFSWDRVALDTFDGRMHAAGIIVWRDARTRSGMAHLTIEPGLPPLKVAVPSVRRAHTFASDLPAGAAREMLHKLSAGRALLPGARVRMRAQPVGIRNADGKTVARVVIQDPSVVLPGGAVKRLLRRAHVAPVLGHERAFARTTKLLRASAGRGAAEQTLVEEATAASHLPVGGVSNKLGIELDPHMRADQASALICQRLAEIVEANLPGTLDDIDAEFLHDLRVAVRRTRSVLKETRHVLTSGAVARARDDLRWIQGITGPTRDLDVQLAGWPALVASARAPADDVAVLRRLLEARRASAFRSMRRGLRSARYAEAWQSWREELDRLVAVGNESDTVEVPDPVAVVAGARITSVYKATVKLGNAIDNSSPPERLHDLRKRSKELRYLIDVFGSLWPSEPVMALIARLKELQDVLGHFQDAAIQASRLRDLGPTPAGSPDGADALLALGRVLDALATEQLMARETLADRFTPFASAKTRALVTHTFRPTGGRVRT